MDANGAISSLIEGQPNTFASDLGPVLVLRTRNPLHGVSTSGAQDFNGVWDDVVEVINGVAYLRVVVVA